MSFRKWWDNWKGFIIMIGSVILFMVALAFLINITQNHQQAKILKSSSQPDESVPADVGKFKHLDAYTKAPKPEALRFPWQIGGYKVLGAYASGDQRPYFWLKLERTSDHARRFIRVSQQLFMAVDVGKEYTMPAEREEKQ